MKAPCQQITHHLKPHICVQRANATASIKRIPATPFTLKKLKYFITTKSIY